MSNSTVRDAPLLPTYARTGVTFERGEGSWLVADDGRRYLDFMAGIAVVGLGHRHPAVTAAAHMQVDRLSERFGGARAFFCNSGAEANEAALKYARKATGRTGIVALESSFHGRTMGALSVTGQPGKRAAFEPLIPGVTFARLNDVESLRVACAGEPPACILLELVQGEGGVNEATPAFLAAAVELAEETGALLVFDEVQTGVGRTGSFFCFEQLGVRPALATLAKGLANGLPVGCLLVADDAPEAFEPGDHASTFGGNPVSCAAACAVDDALTEELLEAVRGHGARLMAELRGMAGVVEARGRGLLVGAELDRPAAGVVSGCLERGLLVTSAGDRVLRLTPPLTVSGAEIEQALATIGEALG